MSNPDPVLLGDVQETLLVPLYGRAVFTRQHPALIDDPRAVEMVEAIDYDFARFDGKMSLVGSVFRTRIFDRWVSRWLADNPTGTVVEIGAGLNTRHERLDNGTARWIEIDLPDVVDLRRRFFAENDRRRILAASILDPNAWVPAVEATGGPWFFAAEAVLIYLEPADVVDVLATIGTRFGGSPIGLDTWATWMADHQDDHDTIGAMDAEFRWFCDDPGTLEVLGVDVEVVERFTFVDAPTELQALLPEGLREMLPALADDPQMRSYHQNLLTLAPAPEPDR
jgi:O-methyltransferase involved in polyketide biosynthesis